MSHPVRLGVRLLLFYLAALLFIPVAASAQSTGTVSGVVVDDRDGTPLANVYVTLEQRVLMPPGMAYGAATGADGTFAFSVPAGDYRLHFRRDGFIAEAYDNRACPQFCWDPNLGDTITVAAGSAFTVNVGLAPAGQISGTVSAADGGAIEPNVSVYNLSGVVVAGAYTSSGPYTADGLPTGSYYVQASAPGYLTEMYSGHVCGSSCNVFTGDLVSVTAGSPTSGINFVLTRAATISGTVTEEGTGLPIANAGVVVLDTMGMWVSSTATGPDGGYISTPLPPGNYRVQVSSARGFLLEAYDNVACAHAPCMWNEGTPLAVGTSSLTDINFALQRGAVLSGSIRNTNGEVITDAGVQLYDSTGIFVTSVSVNPATFEYELPAVRSGWYRAATFNASGYVNEAYDNVPCGQSCEPVAGTLFELTAPSPRRIDFVLERGGTISGTVTTSDGSPVPIMAWIHVLTSNGQSAASTWLMDPSGLYSISGLPSGQYRVQIGSVPGFMPQAYNGIQCSGFCAWDVGNLVTVTAGTTTPNIDFVLARGASISGRVTEQGSGTPIANAGVAVLTESGMWVTSSWTSDTGEYTIGGLAAGNYRAQVSWAPESFFHEAWNDVPCDAWCQPTAGTIITLALSEGRAGIDFALERGGAISGTVTSSTGTPLGPTAWINVYNLSTGSYVNVASVREDGTYTVAPLRTGSYAVFTSNSAGYINEAWDNIPCTASCSPTLGSPVPVSAPGTTSGINFVLEMGGTITGVVRGSGDAPLPNVYVAAYDATGNGFWSAATGADGRYTIAGLAAGSYFLQTRNTAGYVDEAYGNVYCTPYCSNTSGTPVPVAAGGTTTADFDLEEGGRISGRVVNAAGAPIMGAYVSAYLWTGGSTPSQTTGPDGTYTITGLATGEYYARAQASGYITQIYAGIPCVAGSCYSATGTPIQVTMGATTSAIDFNLAPGGSISVRLRGPGDVPVSRGWVETYTAGGNSIGRSYQGYAGAPDDVLISGLTTGAYYLRAGSDDGYLSRLYGGGTCMPRCDVLSGASVSVEAGLTSTITIELEPGGRIAGTVTTEDGTPTGTYVSVGAYDASGNYMSSGYLSPGGSAFITGTGLPPGTYYLKTSNNGGFIDELYDNLPCTGGRCPVAPGTPIVISGTETVIDRNFSLVRGGSISGRVNVTAADGSSITPSGISVQLADERGYSIAGAYVSPSGAYSFTTGLPTGIYYARVAGYGTPIVSELYGGIVCSGSCRIVDGTPIVVTSPNTTVDINFDVQLGGRIVGTIRDAATNAGVPYSNVTVYNDSGRAISAGSADPTGRYSTREGLPTGVYHMRASGPGYVPASLGNNTCLANCAIADTATVDVTIGADTEANFLLEKGALVSGRVTNGSGAAIPGARVAIVDATGAAMVFGSPDAFSGTFRTRDGVPAGSYYVRTENSAGYLNEIFDNVACSESCAPAVAGGTRLDMAAGTTTSGIDFVLGLDPDADSDGINDSIDATRGSSSDDFSDVALGGTTDGRIAARNGWTVQVVDVSPAGVRVTAAGLGAGPAAIDLCSNSGDERLMLDVAGERADARCNAAGTVFVRALEAFPTIELRKPATGPATVVEIGVNQSVSMGSPIEAGESNTEPILVRYVDASGETVASFELDAGEAVDSSIAGGEARIEVIVGDVSVTIAGSEEPLQLGAGESVELPVGDLEAPIIGGVMINPASLWPPDHRLVPVVASILVTDDSGSSPVCTITGVTSNEPLNGTGDGDTSPDWVITGAMSVDLRAERAGTGDGRTYTLAISCADSAGNTATTTAAVVVPKSRK